MTFSYKERFIALTDLLNRYAPLYRERPFIGIPVSWEPQFPELSAALRSLTMDEVARYENRPLSIPGVMAACPDLVDELAHLTTWPALVSHDAADCPEMPRRVRHRKWRQISRFVSAVEAYAPEKPMRWVDWCAGKGHLAGELNRVFGREVTCIEKNEDLCRAGEAEAEIRGRALAFVCEDVLEEGVTSRLTRDTAVTALHACGHLNTRLLSLCVSRGVPFLALAPCCYQRIDGMTHRPLSRAASENAVPLTRHLLRLTALSDHRPSEVKRGFRQRQHAFRLGLDLLIREATGVDVYQPLGRIGPELMRQDFELFAKAVAREKGAALPESVDWGAAEAEGWRRFHLTSALGLARALFSRAIESWLLLDRVLYLEENGYDVAVGRFCEEGMSPRNLMILGIEAALKWGPVKNAKFRLTASEGTRKGSPYHEFDAVCTGGPCGCPPIIE